MHFQTSAQPPLQLPEGVCLIHNQHGREFLQIDHPAVSARIAMEGAHITHCQPTGQGPLLWMSSSEPEHPGKTIRGGIPLCWPWFSDTRAGPAHGIARISPWELTAISSDAEQVSVRMSLADSLIEQALPGEKWQLDVEFVLGSDLMVTLITRNTGSDAQALSQALHSYLPISNIDQVMVQGLESCTYLDQLTGHLQIQQGPVRFTAETDRIYFNHSGELRLIDANKQVISVHREGSDSVVVWNPWIEKSLRLSHFASDDYRHMLCIEAANAGPDARMIEPGETHRLSSRITRDAADSSVV